MRPAARSLAVLVALSACTAESAPRVAAAPRFCDDGPAYVYAPSRDTFLTTFPDDWWTVPDDTTVTGRRVDLSPDTTPGLDDFPADFVENFDHLSTLDGFGLTPPVVMQFDADVSDRVDA